MPAMPKPQDGDVEAAVPAPATVAAGKAGPDQAAAEAAKPAGRKVAEEEDPRLRWAFVRKVFAILALQFALTAAVSVAACLVRAVPRFFATGPAAAVWPVFIGILVSPLIVMFPMLKYREKHPTNLVLLGVFTLCCSLSIAMTTSTSLAPAMFAIYTIDFLLLSPYRVIICNGQCPVLSPLAGPVSFLVASFGVVLQAAILTAVAVLGLTLFTFWAVKKGYDFTFMSPFLFTCLNVLLVYLVIQIFFPVGRVGITIYGFLATLVFSGFIIFDTHMLLKRHTYNEYVVAAISLYLDVINLFMAQMSLSLQ